jgi:hypothetical protein
LHFDRRLEVLLDETEITMFTSLNSGLDVAKRFAKLLNSPTTAPLQKLANKKIRAFVFGRIREFEDCLIALCFRLQGEREHVTENRQASIDRRASHRFTPFFLFQRTPRAQV